jgi:uncharacterized protein (TIGR00730 family)
MTAKRPSPIISVFGSSTPRPGDHDYTQAMTVGRLLAENGYAVATGGYMGTMEAVSRGAAEAGGHVIGVTSAQIEQYRAAGHNRWVTEVIWYPTLRERLLHLVTQNEGIITLPGGIGTISEMTLAWSFLQVGEISPRPLVRLGVIWRETINSVIRPDYIHERYTTLIRYALTPAEAVAALTNK